MVTLQEQDGIILPSPPHSKFVQVSRIMTSYINQEGVIKFITHIMRLSGETEQAPKNIGKWNKRVKIGDWLGFYCS